MTHMSSERLESFLDRPLLAHLVTLKADGSPHVAPVWYEYKDGTFMVWTNKGTRKYRNLIRNSKVALSIANNEEPYEYVVAEGTAEVTGQGVKPLALSIASRYRGPEGGNRFVEGRFREGFHVIVRIQPSKFIVRSEA